MPTASEKEAFSKRLLSAMQRATPPIHGATELAEVLSKHHPEAVSPQTAHKWLKGRATPRPAMAALLAKTLGVREHWLRYGPDPDKVSKARKRVTSPPSQEALDLAGQIHTLSPTKRKLIKELVKHLLSSD